MCLARQGQHHSTCCGILLYFYVKGSNASGACTEGILQFLSFVHNEKIFNSYHYIYVYSCSKLCLHNLLSHVLMLMSLYPSLLGVISVLKPLDYETGRDYFLTVEAWDGGTPPLSAITTININLTDVNDNAPMFSCDLYTAVVSEDAAIDTFIVKVGFGQY